MLTLISGKQGSGKTTLAKSLQRDLTEAGWTVVRNRFAQPLYDMHDEVRNVLKAYAYENYDFTKKDGPLLQLLGTEWGRQTVDKDIWVNLLAGHYKKSWEISTQFGQKKDKFLYVVEDCRFQNELDYFPGAFSIRLEASEEARKERCEMWRDRSDHPSEIGLDHYVGTGKFSMVVNADKNNGAQVLELVKKGIFEEMEKRMKHEHSTISEGSGTGAPQEV
jgi:tRNA uridine 5-carbamoylmethylation protein Kti12